jgi:uncharacterized protein
MIVVSDTTALSNLAIVQQLALLQQLYQEVCIPQAVANELNQVSSENIVIKAVLDLPWVRVCSVRNFAQVETLRSDRQLDPGESEAIVLALELNADRLLIDERLGRREAIRLGLPITGVLGILVAAKQEGLLSAVKPILDDLIYASGFWVSEQLYVEILQSVKE